MKRKPLSKNVVNGGRRGERLMKGGAFTIVSRSGRVFTARLVSTFKTGQQKWAVFKSVR